jgi:CheY-like chemotaxis protein
MAERAGSAGRNGFHAVPERSETAIGQLGRLAADAPCQEGEASAVGPLAATGAGRGRLLLAEDNAINRELAEAILTRAGYDVDCVADGVQAVAAVRRQAYDLVLMDVQMPVMDGFQATREIRQIDGIAASIPIIAMTANAMLGDREDCLAAGMDDYVPKPFDTARLLEMVERWIGGPPPGLPAPVPIARAGSERRPL